MALVKFSLGVLGGVTLAIAAVLVAVSVGLFTFVGSSDAIEIPDVHITTTDGTILAEDIEFLFGDAQFLPDLGTANLRIRSTDGTPVFAGVTDRLTAERFLADADDPRRLGFWVASAEGPTADLAWDLDGDQWTFVVAGADGVAPGEVVIGGTLAASPFRFAAGTVAGLGVATGIAGGLLLLASVRLGRRRGPVAPTPRRPVPATAGA